MLRGISISDYRSIGDMQRIAPLGKINLFVGPNNSGKSNILRFVNENLARLIKTLRSGDKQALASTPHLRRGKPTRGALAVAASVAAIQNAFGHSDQHPHDLVSRLHEKLAVEDAIWIDEQWPDKELIEQAVKWTGSQDWYAFWAGLTKQSGGDLRVHWVPGTLRLLRRLVPPETSVFAIPTNRQAGHEPETADKEETVRVLGGRGVIRELAAMQNPQHANFDEDRKRFRAIEEFVRIVTDDSSSHISVTHKQDEILVQMKGQPYLPLASLGSGIEQVVLHAVAATSAVNAIVTFEEPEVHLHPVLQRQLMTYLARTSNQYFISTHSAHLIDALHADTFHVRLVDGQTVVEKACTDAQRHQICSDLGYRASDIVQANCVVWVEGPSDRIYLRHWLRQFDPHLSEHVHFSIMFYGGKLLSHLTAGETDSVDAGLEDLIRLRLLNRHVAVVIDSDLSSAAGRVRETKTRVASEISEHGGLVWISAGREVENYVPRETLAAAVDHVAPGRGQAVKGGTYCKALPSAKPSAKATVDKVATASKVEELGCALERLDLKERIRELSTFIRKANGLGPLASPVVQTA